MKQPRAARSVQELLDASDHLGEQSRQLSTKCAEQSRHLADIVNQSKEVTLYNELLKAQFGHFRPRRTRVPEQEAE
jgi:hypothetical protein